MGAPADEELQLATSRALLPNVQGIRTFFELSRDMEQVCVLRTMLLPITYSCEVWHSVALLVTD